MRFIYDNVVAIQVALVCSLFAWLYGGTLPSTLLPTMPWMLAILAEVLICFPQRHAGETTYEARARVWRRLGRDPLTWVCLGFTAMLIIPFFNKGLCLSCDYPAIAFDGKPAEPPIAFIPFCVNRAEHLTVVLWFVPALTAMLAVKHALLKRGKRMMLTLVVWNGVILALVGMLQYVTGAKAPLWGDPEGATAYFFSTFGYPNMAGDYFFLLFGLSVALWRWNVEAERKAAVQGGGSVTLHGHKAFWRQHLLLVPSFILFIGALMTLSRMAMGVVSLLAVVFYIHTTVSFLARMKKAQRVKGLFVNLVILVVLATLVYAFKKGELKIRKSGSSGESAPVAEVDSTVAADGKATSEQNTDREFIAKYTSEEYQSLNEEEKLWETTIENARRESERISLVDGLDRATGHGNQHVAIALRVWKDHPFFGCGGWGYRHFSVDKMTDDEFDHMQTVGGVNVHNDYLQFLAEHGAVGLILFFLVIGLLLWPVFRIWRKMIEAVRFLKAQPPKPIAIFALPAPVFCILVTVLMTMLHALIDCPLRSPAVLTLFFVSMAALDGFLPHVKEQH